MKNIGTSRWIKAMVSLAMLATLMVLPLSAEARGRSRGPSTKQIQAYNQKMQQAYQQQQQAIQQQQAQLMARFDKNGNGKLDSNEKPAFDKYMREARLNNK